MDTVGVDEDPTTNPKYAFGAKKVPLELVPPAASAMIACGLREGAVKYGAWNYRDTRIDYMTYLGAIKRHLDALLEGEDIDPDPIIDPKTKQEIKWLPKKHHLAGLMASAAILADQITSGDVVDNRPKANTGYRQLMEANMKQET